MESCISGKIPEGDQARQLKNLNRPYPHSNNDARTPYFHLMVDLPQQNAESAQNLPGLESAVTVPEDRPDCQIFAATLLLHQLLVNFLMSVRDRRIG